MTRIACRMFAVGRAAVAAVVLLSAAVDTAAGQETDAKRQVDAAIKDATRLLEAKQHVEFIKTYMRPNEIERLLPKFGSIETLATEFGKEAAGTMLKALQAAAKLVPVFNETMTSARYTFETPIGRERGLLLQKIGDRWYVAD